MPLYEEKLICPLSVRFMQEHIRPEFQDGRDLETTIEAIKERPGTGPYDVILEAPFDKIGIVRWHSRDRGSNREWNWFASDNRRLYCLQRVAAALWPRRVGIEVEALYAIPEGDLRKSDSSTGGRAVGIGHSLKALTGSWNWRDSLNVDQESGILCETASQLVSDDEDKSKAIELLDAPAAPSMLKMFLQAVASGAGADVAVSPASPSMPRDNVSEDSTKASTPRSVFFGQAPSSCKVAVEMAWWKSLEGTWEDEKGDVCEVKPGAMNCWTCTYIGKSRTKKSHIVYDQAHDTIWWGSAWTYWADVCASGGGQDGSIWWFAENDYKMRNPRFRWNRISGAEAITDPRVSKTK